MNEISVNGEFVQKNKHLIERSMMGAQRLCGCWSEEVTTQQKPTEGPPVGSPISFVHMHVQWMQLKLSHGPNCIIQPLVFSNVDPRSLVEFIKLKAKLFEF